VARTLKRVIDREGRLSLPEAGTIEVSGHTLGEAQRLVQAALRTQFRDVQADISLGRLRKSSVCRRPTIGPPCWPSIWVTPWPAGIKTCCSNPLIRYESLAGLILKIDRR
jgi:hypothetical protein